MATERERMMVEAYGFVACRDEGCTREDLHAAGSCELEEGEEVRSKNGRRPPKWVCLHCLVINPKAKTECDHCLWPRPKTRKEREERSRIFRAFKRAFA